MADSEPSRRTLPQLEDLYESAPCGLALADARGKLLHVNPIFCRWLGYSRQELLDGKGLQDLLTVGGRIFYQTHLAPLLRMQGSVAEVKLELRTKGGETLPMMLNLAERSDAGGLLLHVASFVATDRHKYERELLAQRRRAEELAAQHARDQVELASARAQAEDRALFAEQMVGVVSHDLRNPLSAIQMSATLLQMRGQLPAEQKAVVERIARSVGRAERLISQLLDFTQARLGGGLVVRRATVDIHELTAEALSELRLAFADSRLVHERSGPGTCSADADRLVQALGNLVANAVTYGMPGKPVTVATRGSAAGVELSVHNLGAEIPESLRDRLFEPMVRGEKAEPARGGVGLGLYIVHAIAVAHGGQVTATSSAAEGTRFTIALPAGGD